ncbi:helix-turn-helix domain-containing protein [uncultured Bifidobacterium sp.]|uniref:winged helix-turn-helix transcriptional regulator n=1 Tax=uncultured Bifidobacterium sp. TaxID=165187 RepID=UPI00262DBF1F|nr:helix-turn-helix domain-containing protein [uncultured Bifidobacterium sp.]
MTSSKNPKNPHHFNVFAAACPSRKLLNDVTRRWSILVLASLLDGSLRFGQIRERVDGISDRMLSATLGALAEDRLIAKDDAAGTYSLTEPGRQIARQSLELFDSLYLALDEIVDARQAGDDVAGSSAGVAGAAAPGGAAVSDGAVS